MGQTRASYGSPTSSLVVGSIGLLRWAITAEVLAAVELGLGEPETVQVGDLLLDLQAGRVVRGDEEVCLTRLEFDLLAYLVRSAGRVVGYDELLREVWGYDYTAGSQETIKSCVKRLRWKIEPDPAQPRYLVTVRGVGYRWAIPSTSARFQLETK